jgi:hypothetical protein
MPRASFGSVMRRRSNSAWPLTILVVRKRFGVGEGWLTRRAPS